jgi:hypothetical protein
MEATINGSYKHSGSITNSHCHMRNSPISHLKCISQQVLEHMGMRIRRNASCKRHTAAYSTVAQLFEETCTVGG